MVRIYLGIESGSQKVLDYINKNLKKELIIPAINKINKYAIEVMGFFIIGAPIESSHDKGLINY
jgi:radical SAM superfamily enzyme YgiQ (UPF0313 family)